MTEEVISPRDAMQTLPMGQQIQMLQQEAESIRDRLKAMTKTLALVVSTAEEHHHAMANLSDLVPTIGSGDHFTKARDLMADLSQKHLNCVKKQEDHLNSMIKSFVEVKIAAALGMQTKVHEAIKEHEAASERVHSLKKGSPKLADAQAHLATTQQQMDLLSFAYVNKLKQTLIDVQLAALEKFGAFFGEATVYSMSISTQTSALIPELTRQQAELKKQKQSNDEERGRELRRLATAGSDPTGTTPPSNSVSSKDSVKSLALPTTTTHQMKQGYIFCRTSGGKYRQRWVSILNARLMVYKNWQAREAEKTFNLVLCNVKQLPTETSSHPYVFEVRSNMNEHMQFAANDEIEMTQWINVIQNVIAAQLGQNHGSQDGSLGSPHGQPGSVPSYQWQIIRSVKGNDKCADCRLPDPEWISFAQGIVVCIECSGVHRSFGSHISKVRSLKLDALDPELVLLMSSIGNFKANTKVFEFSMPETQRIQPNCDRVTREAFLKAKYVEKKWIPAIEDWQAHVTALMRRKKPFKPTTLLSALVQRNADINWHRPGQQKTLLHKCVASGNFLSALLLLKLECGVDEIDSSGMTALHWAAQVNNAPMARLLMQHGASTTALDSQKRTPRDVAIDNDAVDCIALLDDDLNSEMSMTGEVMPDGTPIDPRLQAAAFGRSVSATAAVTSTILSPRGTSVPALSTPQKKKRPTAASTAVLPTDSIDSARDTKAPSSPSAIRFQSVSLRSSGELSAALGEVPVRYADSISEATQGSNASIGSSGRGLSPSTSSSSLSTAEKRTAMRKSKSAKTVSTPKLNAHSSAPSGVQLPAPLPQPMGDGVITEAKSTGTSPNTALPTPLSLPPPSTDSPRDIPLGSKTRR